MGNKSSYLYVMGKAAEKASHGIVRDFGELEKLQSSQRGLKSFVDKSSSRAVETITKILSRAYPDIPFMPEESRDNCTETPNMVWAINPINGIANFMRGIPHFSINLSLLENMIASAGIILDPLRGEYYRGEVGGGAFVNNRNRLRVSNTKTFSGSLIATNLSLGEDMLLVKNGVTPRKTVAVSLDMAYIAAGKYDACVLREIPLNEVASGILLIREAGGFVKCEKTTDGKYDVVAATSSEFVEKLLGLYNTM